jgi:hypothetical protein
VSVRPVRVRLPGRIRTRTPADVPHPVGVLPFSRERRPGPGESGQRRHAFGAAAFPAGGTCPCGDHDPLGSVPLMIAQPLASRSWRFRAASALAVVVSCLAVPVGRGRPVRF